MKMKKIILIILAAVIISYCGGLRHKPETEPAAPANEPREEVQTRQEEENKKQEESEVEAIEKEKQPVILKEQVEVESIAGENIPVIPPKEEPKKIETIDMVKTRKITDSITTGIAAISKGFGYAGDIEVPNSFKERVAYYIRYFSGEGKGGRFYRRAMNRGSKYLPMIKEVLKKKHLPPSLAYLPVIESGFKTRARSRASAVGMWQFMRGTARMYGLKVSRKIDERRDPVKATYAAAEYLNDLLAMFGMEDPFLGICAYNAGEGKIMRALRKISYKERSFWTLVKKNLLKNETDEYIPQLLAVVLIANNPAKYVTASKNIPPLQDETEDQEILSSLHRTKEDLSAKPKETEAGEEQTVLQIDMNPVEKQKEVKPTPEIVKETKVKAKPPTKKKTIYKVKRGDSLYKIARTFNVSVRRLKKWNNLRYSRIYPGQRLKIYGSSAKVSKSISTKAKKYKLIYTVNYTDSLVRIALFFKGITAREIMRWNGLRRTRIYPKQKLKLFLKQRPKRVVTYIAKRGDTARKIARKHGVRVEYVLSLNGMVTNSRVRPGKRLKIYYF